MVKEINIKDTAQMDRICRLAWDAPYEILLHAGPLTLDARDLTPAQMGGLVGKRVSVVAGDKADPELFGCLVEEMEAFPKARRSLLQRMADAAGRMEPRYGWEMRLRRLQY